MPSNLRQRKHVVLTVSGSTLVARGRGRGRHQKDKRQKTKIKHTNKTTQQKRQPEQTKTQTTHNIQRSLPSPSSTHRQMKLLSRSSLAAYAAFFFRRGVDASVACNETSTCESTLRPGSTASTDTVPIPSPRDVLTQS